MSNTLLDARVMIVLGAIREAIQTSQEPGLSVNAHPNPFFISVIGNIDLRKTAEKVLQRLSQYYEAEQQSQSKRETDAATRASAVDGH